MRNINENATIVLGQKVREGGRRRKERGGEKLKKNGVLLAGYEGGWWG